MKIIAKIGRYRPYLDYIIFGILLCCLPLLITHTEWFRFGWLTIIAGVIVYAIVALGLNLLMGYGGLFSLGTAGFMGLGAYLTAFFTQELNWGFFLSIVVTVAITGVLGILVGLMSLRVEGFFLAMGTLAIAEILRQVFGEFTWFTNGFSGRQARFPVIFPRAGDSINNVLPESMAIFGSPLSRNLTFIVLVIFLVIAMVIAHNITKSYTGRALSAMSGSEAAATAMGVNVLKYRLIIFSISTAFAGLGGALYMHFIRFTTPDIWMFTLSLMIFAAVVIGGVRSIAGTVIGCFIVFGAPDLILANLPVIGDINGMSFVFTGVLIIVVVMYYPAGLVYIGSDFKKLIRKIFRKGGGTV